jgi:hypothetical protein
VGGISRTLPGLRAANEAEESRLKGKSRTYRPILIICLTSRSTIKRTALSLNLSRELTMPPIQRTLRSIKESLHRFVPSTSPEVRCDYTFDNHREVFGVMDASPVFIQRPTWHQEDYHSGKSRRHCVKSQALVTADGQCVHLLKVYGVSIQ